MNNEQLIAAIRDGVPLEEPVSVAKAMMAHSPARAVLDKGTGPLACVCLVNIQATAWVHNPETAKAYADGFNHGADWTRSAIINYAERVTPTAAVAAGTIDKQAYRQSLRHFAYRVYEERLDVDDHAMSALVGFVRAVSECDVKSALENAKCEHDAAITAASQKAREEGRVETDRVRVVWAGKLSTAGARIVGLEKQIADARSQIIAAKDFARKETQRADERTELLIAQRTAGGAAEARAKKAEEELEEWRFTNRIDELEREVNRLRGIPARRALAPPNGAVSELAAFQYWAEGEERVITPLDAWEARAALATQPVPEAAAQADGDPAPKYSTLTGHNGRVTGVHWTNADRMPSVATPAPVNAAEPCADPAECNAQGCCNPNGRCEEAAPVSAGPQDERAACPFCGSSNISDGEISTTDLAGETVTQSMCEDCGACGPGAALNAGEVDYGDVKARAAWNRRASLPSAGAPATMAGDIEFFIEKTAQRAISGIASLKATFMNDLHSRLSAGAPVSGAEQALSDTLKLIRDTAALTGSPLYRLAENGLATYEGRGAVASPADVQELPALPIKTWLERYEPERVYYGSHDVRPYMKAEITELRGFLEKKGFS